MVIFPKKRRKYLQPLHSKVLHLLCGCWIAIPESYLRACLSLLSFTTKNINNYILLSNFDVYDSDRRMFVLDVQTKYKGDREYWSNIYNNCFNNDVGNALYSYFYEIDTTNYHAQDYPITDNKINSIAKRLDFVYQFLKDEYIKPNKDIKSKLSDLYDDYKLWCSGEQKKAC